LVRTGSPVQIWSRAPPNIQIITGVSNGGNARDHQPSVHRVQTSELHDDEEQEDHDREAGAEEVLPA
jgi:hypothetical protein